MHGKTITPGPLQKSYLLPKVSTYKWTPYGDTISNTIHGRLHAIVKVASPGLATVQAEKIVDCKALKYHQHA